MIKFSDVKINKRLVVSEISKLIDSRWLTYGIIGKKLEKSISSFLQTPYSSLTSNCTTALHLSLICYDIKKGDEVIVPSFTWISSINAILMVGAKPVIVDIDSKTLNISPDIIEKNISKKTKAIMIVHQFGNPCDMNKINKIAKKNNLKIIEDAACALGSKYSNGKYVGNTKNLCCFSMHPRKIITSGEGGFIASDNEKFKKKINILLNHGHLKDHKNDQFIELGYNYRLSDIQSVFALSQINELKKMIEYRNLISDIYQSEIKRSGVNFQSILPKAQSSWQSFVIYLDDIDESKQLSKKLRNHNILTRKNYYLAHQQKFLKKYASNDLRTCEKINNSIIFLPMHNRLNFKEVKKISKIINSL